MSEPIWVKYGEQHGWLYRGEVPARELVGSTFWERAARVACIAEGGNIDMVQCYDRAVMSAGPLGANVVSGTLAQLFAAMPRDVLARHLNELFRAANLGLDTANPVAPIFTWGLTVAEPEVLTQAFLLGGDPKTWQPSDETAQHALRWVRALGALLADPAARRALTAATVAMLRQYLDPKIAAPRGWSDTGTPAARKALACWLSFAINNPRGARVLAEASPRSDAEGLLLTAMNGGSWPATFGQRVGRTRAALDAEAW